jgi:hypothetical protein
LRRKNGESDGEMQRIITEVEMDCEIIFSSCQHMGSWLCHYDGIDQLIDDVGSNPSKKLFLLGDAIEAITTDDKRYNDTVKEHIPLKQAREFYRTFKPIKKQIGAILLGNHERKLIKVGNLAELIANEEHLDIPYGTTTARIILQHKGKILFRIFITHDVPVFKSRAKDFLQRQANILAACKNSMQYRMGDCAVMVCGHPHQLLTIPPAPMLYLTDGEKGVKQHYLQGDIGENGGFINPDQRYYGCAGSFRKKFVDGYDDYSDIYDPVELGYLTLKIEGGKPVSLEKKVV